MYVPSSKDCADAGTPAAAGSSSGEVSASIPVAPGESSSRESLALLSRREGRFRLTVLVAGGGIDKAGLSTLLLVVSLSADRALRDVDVPEEAELSE